MKKSVVLILSILFAFCFVSCSENRADEKNTTQPVTMQKTVETPQEDVPVEKFSWNDFGTVEYPYGEIVGVSKTNVRTVIKITSTTFEEYKSYIDMLKKDSFEWHHEYENFVEEKIELDDVMKTSFWDGKNEKENTFVSVKFFDNDSMSHTNYNVILTYYNGPLENGDI